MVDALAIMIVIALNIAVRRFSLVSSLRRHATSALEQGSVTVRWRKVVAVSTVASAVATVMQVILMIIYR